MSKQDNLYGVFLNDHRNRWGITRSKEEAFSGAFMCPGATIRVMKDTSDSGAWDAPTFRLLSDQIYPTNIPAEETWPRAIC